MQIMLQLLQKTEIDILTFQLHMVRILFQTYCATTYTITIK
jgi:hypothetical protein